MHPEKADQIRHDAMMDEYRDSVKEGIRGWFLRRYIDPAESTPYDTREGGFLYQWGGPYNARDILYEEFDGKAESSLIEEVADELESISDEWERIPTIEDIVDDDIFSAFFSRFNSSISSIQRELDKFKDGDGDPFMCSMLFAYTITSLETYLSDAFLACIKDPKHFRAFVESDPELNQEKFSVSEIYKKMETLQADALKRIQSIIFHRLDIVQRMYKATLGIELPPGMKVLIPAILRRHDIIHRGCKDKEGREFVITKAEVATLLGVVKKFIDDLDRDILKVLT